MRFLVCVSLLLVLLFVGCWLAVGYIQYSADQIVAHFDELSAAIDGEDWAQARQLFSHCQAEWEQISSRWKAIINHEDLRDIEISFVDMGIVLEQENLEEAQEEMATLRYYMLHVPDNEKLRLNNIL